MKSIAHGKDHDGYSVWYMTLAMVGHSTMCTSSYGRLHSMVYNNGYVGPCSIVCNSGHDEPSA